MPLTTDESALSPNEALARLIEGNRRFREVSEAETVDDLGKLVVARIQSVEGITRTLTCPVVHL